MNLEKSTKNQAKIGGLDIGLVKLTENLSWKLD